MLAAIEHSFSLVCLRASECRLDARCAARYLINIHPPVMKKLINSPENVVHEAMEGMVAAHGDLLKAHFDPNFLFRADAPVQGKVAIVSGGGSRAEPAH